MFFVVFDKTDRWNAYLDNAKLLRLELEQVDGCAITSVTGA
jgi:hypothetical protein